MNSISSADGDHILKPADIEVAEDDLVVVVRCESQAHVADRCSEHEDPMPDFDWETLLRCWES